MTLSVKAKEFAEHAHREHVRSDEAKTPYIFHLEEVAELVRASGGSDEEIAAAWLHDSVEDTEVTIEDIRREFGDTVGDIVDGVTDLLEWLPLPIGERKAKQAERVAKESASIRRVKLADQTSNVQIVGLGNDAFTMDIKFVYIDSTKKIAEACKGVSPYLDSLFAERYEVAHKNLTVLRAQLSEENGG